VAQQAAVFSIRQDYWKLLLNAKPVNASAKGGRLFTPAGLYNLASDTGEKSDLSAAETERVKSLTARLTKYQTDGHTRLGWRSAP